MGQSVVGCYKSSAWQTTVKVVGRWTSIELDSKIEWPQGDGEWCPDVLLYINTAPDRKIPTLVTSLRQLISSVMERWKNRRNRWTCRWLGGRTAVGVCRFISVAHNTEKGTQSKQLQLKITHVHVSTVRNGSITSFFFLWWWYSLGHHWIKLVGVQLQTLISFFKKSIRFRSVRCACDDVWIIRLEATAYFFCFFKIYFWWSVR